MRWNLQLWHNLPLRKVTEGDDCQLYRNMISNVQVSLQATRKKRFTSLNLECSWASNTTTYSDTTTFRNRRWIRVKIVIGSQPEVGIDWQQCHPKTTYS